MNIHDLLVTQAWGAPVWAYMAAIAILVSEDLIARSKWKSNSWVQLAGVGLGYGLRFVSKFPVISMIVAKKQQAVNVPNEKKEEIE